MVGDARTRQEYRDFFFGAGWLGDAAMPPEDVNRNGFALHAHERPPMRARHVREHERLPNDGRGAIDDLERLEHVMCETMSPDVPSYDVNSVQDINFDEWSYTEGLHCLMVFTQSVEINARLMANVVAWDGDNQMADSPAKRIAATLGDKWAGAAPSGPHIHAPDLYTFFPPGNNLIGQIVNVDNVLRAFDGDPRWMMKPHPDIDGRMRGRHAAHFRRYAHLQPEGIRHGDSAPKRRSWLHDGIRDGSHGAPAPTEDGGFLALRARITRTLPSALQGDQGYLCYPAQRDQADNGVPLVWNYARLILRTTRRRIGSGSTSAARWRSGTPSGP